MRALSSTIVSDISQLIVYGAGELTSLVCEFSSDKSFGDADGPFVGGVVEYLPNMADPKGAGRID